MSNDIIDTTQLKQVLGYTSTGALMRALDDQGIKYFLGKGGNPWTTIQIINATKGLVPGQREQLMGVEIL